MKKMPNIKTLIMCIIVNIVILAMIFLHPNLLISNYIGTIVQNNQKNDDQVSIDQMSKITPRIAEISSMASGTRSNKKKEIIVSCINDMKTKNLKKGDICITKGYYKDGDYGAAKYIIIKGKYKDNGITIHALKNGLYATLIIENNYINVMVAGIRTEDRISSRLNSLLVLLEGKVETLNFNDGRYYIDKVVYLKSFSYIGASLTEFYVTTDFDPNKDDKVFTTNASYKKGIMTKLSFVKINFVFETSNEHSMKDKETVFIQLTGISYCLIDQCSIISKQSESNGIPMAIDNLWFRDGDNSNITIKNSKIQNLTCNKEDNQQRAGGCIWVWGNDNRYEISDFTISNCILETTVNDEALAFWECKAENVQINNTTLICGIHLNDNLVAFYDMDYKNVVFSLCNFVINSKSTRVFKSVSNNSADLLIKGCSFELNCNVSDPWKDLISVFSFSSAQNNEKSVTDRAAACVHKIEKCLITTTNETEYRILVDCNNAKVKLKKNTIKGNFNSGVLWTENAYVNASFKNNYIDTGTNGIFMVLKDLSDTQSLVSVFDNTIIQSIKSVMEGNISLKYDVERNKINCVVWSPLYQDSYSKLNSESSEIIFYDNIIEEESNFALVNTNQGEEYRNKIKSIISESNTIYNTSVN